MDRPIVWAMFYAGLVSIRMHPRNEEKVDVHELALVADAMMKEFEARHRGAVWLGSPQ